MEVTLEQALQKGVEAHKAGNVQEAEHYYTAILKANPKHPDANHNMGVLAVGVDKVEPALPFFKTALEANSNVAQYWLSYIDALIKLDRLEDAKAVFNQAERKGVKGDRFDQLEKQLNAPKSQPSRNAQEPSQSQLQSLIHLYSKGQLQEALNQASRLILEYPQSVVLCNIIGAVNHGLGKLEDATEAYAKAISLNPNYADAYNNLGNALRDQEKLEQAIETYNKVLSIKPDYTEAYYNLGNTLKDQGKLQEAIEAYQKALTIKPDYAEAFNNMGIILCEQGRLDESIITYQKALTIKPDYADCYYNMGIALHEQGEITEAIEAYKKTLLIKPKDAKAYNNLGVALKDRGEIKEAIEAYKNAISFKSDFAEAHRNLSVIKKYTHNDDHFLQVKRYCQKVGLSEETKCNLNFALAKIYSDLGELQNAFKHLSEGNALRKKLLNYSIDQDKRLFTRLKGTMPSLLKISPKLKEHCTYTIPIFILGMPRSGTTLIEQIVSSHSAVTAAGELRYLHQYGYKLATNGSSVDATSLYDFRQRYLKKLSTLSRGKQFTTDKMPHNFQYIPLILTAIPEARIIHVKRDAAATCWSNYKHFFISKDLGYCYDIEDVISYYGLYTDLMALWNSEYGDKIYNLNYDNLTTNQEIETKKLIKHLGLGWENICLSPHEHKRSVRTASQQQVRKKIYQGSSEAWREFEPFLNGALNRLSSLQN